jgi:hypothetical protein
MENTRITWQLPSWRPRDLALPDRGSREQSQRPATNLRLAGDRPLTADAAELQRGAGGYAMSSMAMAAKAVQGDRAAIVGGVHVTDITFLYRLGPPLLRPPV